MLHPIPPEAFLNGDTALGQVYRFLLSAFRYDESAAQAEGKRRHSFGRQLLSAAHRRTGLEMRPPPQDRRNNIVDKTGLRRTAST
jgi:hypothetical protein